MTETPYDPAGTPPSRPTGSASYQLARFFDWIRASGFVRGSDRWLAGVCGSIAARTGLDPMIVRGIAIVIAILGGPLVFAYAVSWALIPNTEGRIYLEEAFRKRFEPAMIVIGALLVFTIVPVFRGFWWNGMPGAWGMPDWLATTFSIGWGLLITAAVIWLVVVMLRRLPASTFRSGPTANGFTPTGSAPTSSSGATAYSGYGGSSSVGSAYAAAGTAPASGTGTGTATGTSAGATATTPIADRGAWDALTEQHASQRDAHRESGRLRQEARDRRRNPGAGFTAIVLGLALLAAATTAVVFSRGSWSPEALVLGLATGVGVLALGIIVSGIRGRVSGAMGGFAFLAAIALLVVGVIPAGTQFSAFGGSGWRAEATSSSNTLGPGSSPGFAMIAGEANVDVRALSDTRNADHVDGRVIDIWVGLGVTQLELPSNTAVRVETNTFIGAVDYDAGGNFGSSADDADRGGVFLHDSRIFSADDAEYDVPIPVIRVWSLIGQVNIIEAR